MSNKFKNYLRNIAEKSCETSEDENDELFREKNYGVKALKERIRGIDERLP